MVSLIEPPVVDSANPTAGHVGARRRRTRGAPVDLRELFCEYYVTRDLALRNRLVEAHLHLAEYYVRRFTQRQVSREDLQQLALMAVIHAVERYDPDRGVSFRTFASRTIEGECKRYLRDRSWSVRPPRRLQELHLAIRRTDEELSHELGRSPSTAELSARLGVSVAELLDAIEASGAHQAASLDAPAPGDDGDGATLGEIVTGRTEPGFAEVDGQRVVAELFHGLSERDRRILYLRYYRNLTQPEIAQIEGMSQSYLSRLLRRIVEDLRQQAARGAELGADEKVAAY